MSEGSSFDTRSDTTVDEIIQLFNAKGVYYEERRWVWHLGL